MKPNGNQQQLIEINNSLWKLIWKPAQINEHQWALTPINESQYKSMRPNENYTSPWNKLILIQIHENQLHEIETDANRCNAWKSLKTHEHVWTIVKTKSWALNKTNAHQWDSMEADEHLYESVKKIKSMNTNTNPC